MIYLDHNATTPPAPAVLEAMAKAARDGFANPSSVHLPGQRARALLDDARERLAATLGCDPNELVLTSGGTEADNLALRGAWAARRAGANRLVLSAVEHPAVRETARALAAAGAEVVELAVDRAGRLDPAALDRALEAPTALVSVMWANNETGAVHPVEQLGLRCRARGVLFHVDAVQAAGRLPLDLARFPVDLLSLSAHKLHGPRGAGALFVRRGVRLGPVLTGGHQEGGVRAGTENVAAAVGFAEAVALAAAALDTEPGRQRALRDRLEAGLSASLPDVEIFAHAAERLPNTSCVGFPGVEAEALLMALDLAGIAASAGSACSSGSLEPSPVLLAMGVEPALARGAVRFSLGRENTAEEIERTVEAVAAAVGALRRHAR